MPREVAAKLPAAGLRVETDLRNEKINYKVREHSLAKVPLLLVVGKREAEEGTVAVRRLGSDEHQKIMTLDEAIAAFAAEAMPPDLRRVLTPARHSAAQNARAAARSPLSMARRKPYLAHRNQQLKETSLYHRPIRAVRWRRRNSPAPVTTSSSSPRRSG